VKIWAIDFDGTLSRGRFPGVGPANEELMDIIKKILSEPLEKRSVFLVLWTSRHGETLQNALEWLESEGVIFDSVNSVPAELTGYPEDTRKIFADIYVDDRAISPSDFIDCYYTGRI